MSLSLLNPPMMLRSFWDEITSRNRHTVLSLLLLSLLFTTVAAQSPASTVLIPALPTLTTIILNSTHPLLHVNLPPQTRYLTLNLCSLSSNTSLIPVVLVSTTSPPVYDLGAQPVSAAGSGGVGTANLRSRTTNTWEISWDKGFGNWTGVSTGEVDVLIGLNVANNGSLIGGVSATGNVVVQLGASATGT